MFGRIQLLLIVLLFVLTGNITRHQEALPGRCRTGCAVFMEQAAPEKHVENSFVSHSLYAPEAMYDSQSETQGYKAPAVTVLLPGYRAEAAFPEAKFPTPESVDPHPRPTDYYIFSLEKILI